MSTTNKTLLVILALAVIAVAAYFSMGNRTSAPSSAVPLTVDTKSGNYGLFIDNTDNDYFSTKDANVKGIINAYLTNPAQIADPTDAQKYGSSLIYYYDSNAFIAAEKSDAANNASVTAFTMRNIKTGQRINDCNIYTSAGLYKDSDLLLSVSSEDNGKFGVCMYKRGDPNFSFIDLSSQLSSTETLFSDPAGQNLKAGIKNVDTQKKTFSVDVYDTSKKDANGAYVYKRSLEVSY